MLEGLFGSRAAELTLFYLAHYGEGYPRAIARTYGMSVSQVNKQLHKLESTGLLTAREVGRTRLYSWNPRNPLAERLRAFLEDAIDTLPPGEFEPYYVQRRRPRRSGKPLASK